MNDIRYDRLVQRAAVTARETGQVDLVDASEAASLGYMLSAFTRDVLNAAANPEQDT